MIIDTGPLVAFLDQRDRHHDWAVASLAPLRPPLLTCEAVLSEACFLVRHLPGGREAVLDLLGRGAISVSFSLANEVIAVRRLLHRYANVPMSLADACLVRMTELVDGVVVTCDSDFRVYRRNGRAAISTRMPS